MNELNNISNAINYLNSTDFIKVILCGDKNFDNVSNFKIPYSDKFLTRRKFGAIGAKWKKSPN